MGERAQWLQDAGDMDTLMDSGRVSVSMRSLAMSTGGALMTSNSEVPNMAASSSQARQGVLDELMDGLSDLLDAEEECGRAGPKDVPENGTVLQQERVLRENAVVGVTHLLGLKKPGMLEAALQTEALACLDSIAPLWQSMANHRKRPSLRSGGAEWRMVRLHDALRPCLRQRGCPDAPIGNTEACMFQVKSTAG